MNRRFDTLAHGLLAAGFVAGAAVIYTLRFDSQKQYLGLLLMAAFYLLWGLVYHHIRGDFNKKLLVEYLLVAAIAVAGGFLVLVS